MEEKLFKEYVGKELREFIFNEDIESINYRTVWVYVDNMWNLLIYSDCLSALLKLGGGVKLSLIDDIIVDNMDISIIINNPFKGVD